MKNIAVFILSVLMLSSCNAQTDKKADSKEKIKPKVDYKVNKEYDENGNLIKYDSIYTYYYSNIDKDTLMNDSILKKLKEHFSLEGTNINDDFFNDFFNEGTYLEDDFFSEDFFRGNINKHQEMMYKMLSRMDSLKNRFFIEQYPLKREKKEKEIKK